MARANRARLLYPRRLNKDQAHARTAATWRWMRAPRLTLRFSSGYGTAAAMKRLHHVPCYEADVTQHAVEVPIALPGQTGISRTFLTGQNFPALEGYWDFALNNLRLRIVGVLATLRSRQAGHVALDVADVAYAGPPKGKIAEAIRARGATPGIPPAREWQAETPQG